MEDDENLDEAVNALLAMIEAGSADLARQLGDVRIFAAAGLLRCRRLLLAIRLQIEAGYSDTVGGQLRTLVETYLASMWIILEPHSAYDQLHYMAVTEFGKLNRLAGLGLEDLQRDREPVKVKTWEQIADHVGRLAEERGEEGGLQSMRHMYNVLYRSESLQSTHAGLHSVSGHIDLIDGLRAEARPERREAVRMGRGQVLAGAALTGVLAVYVFREFGIDSREMERLALRIGRKGP